MKKQHQSKGLERLLEILPGFAAWAFILFPFIFSSIAPTFVAIVILIYSFFWLTKSLNISRHLMSGFRRLHRNMKIDWLELCKKTENISELEDYLKRKYKAKSNRYNLEDYLLIKNLEGKQELIKDWKEIKHLVIIAVSKETLDVLEPTFEALSNSNYPKEKLLVVVAAEDKYRETAQEAISYLEKKYAGEFGELRYYWHVKKDDEVVGKGPNLVCAGRGFWNEFENKLRPDDLLVTTLDADHIVHPEYFARLSYLYAIDPSREIKSYQPVPLLFNNIWDAPYLNRIGAVSSSFWQIVEAMRPYRLRTFAAHAQSMTVLLRTDFWSTTTIVEDGHQYWRTYFALNGIHQMVPVLIPIYQDAVIGENLMVALKSQYLQRRRWAWGVSDFPYVVLNSLKHKEIPLSDRLLQIFRHLAGTFSWSTASFFLAGAWIPLTFNRHFQDTVLAHNIAAYSSQLLRIAWVGIILNVWISLILAPPRPKKHKLKFELEMMAMWVFSPIYAIFLSALPALESQTRLMFGKKLDVFWITPKVRKTHAEITGQKGETP